MKYLSKKGFFPCFTIALGVAGFIMQCWLFSATDNQGLLPQNHIAGAVSFALLALTLAVCWMGTRVKHHGPAFSGTASAAGIALSAIGIAFSAFTAGGTGILQILTLLSGILSAVSLGYLAFCRHKDLRADSALHLVMIVHLILRAMSNCSSWSAEPQFQQYFFPLLACVFLMIAAYYRAALALDMQHGKQYIFFSQAALFCCILCCRGSDWLFYLSNALWLTFDCPASPAPVKACDE